MQETWKALADPTRRGILDLLRAEPRTTSEICAAFGDLTRFKVMNHMAVLRDAGLVRSEKRGRERINSLDAAPLGEAYEDWMRHYEVEWAGRLGRLQKYIESNRNRDAGEPPPGDATPKETEMSKFHDKTMPNENADYRAARDRLLEAELELRRQVETVAALRRTLPTGGAPKEDFVFDEMDDAGAVKHTRLSELFEDGKSSLILYSLMYGPGGAPCPMCTAMLDGLDGNIPHIRQRANIAVVGKADIGTLRDFAAQRGWRHHRVLSSNGNTYNADYWGENAEGAQMPALNVFVKAGDGIRHSYMTETMFANAEQGQDPRHIDMMWPLWNMLDLTPEGRGDWYPGLSYD